MLMGFQKFIHLRDSRTKEEMKISEDGLIITKQVSNSLDIKTGDMVTFINNKDEEALIEVKGITENYTANFAYISLDFIMRYLLKS